jgi:Domain of unknown function (DUF4091)
MRGFPYNGNRIMAIMAVRPTLVAILAVAPFACAAPVSLWPVDALVKVFPDQAAETNRAVSNIWLIARNGHASVQFAVRSATGIKDLNASVTCGGGLRCEVRHAGYVPVSSNPPGTPSDEILRAAPSFFPDPLFETFPYSLPPNRTDAIWITVYAPASVAPGDYRGEAVIQSGAQRVAAGQFQIRVAEATVPEQQTLRVTNWFNTAPDHLAQYYTLLGSGDDDRYWALLANIAGVMAAHKQNVILTPVMELSAPRVEGEKLVFDFTRLDRWVETFSKAGIPIIEGGHLLGRVSGYQTPLRVPAYVIENGKPVVEKLTAEDPRAEQYLHSFLSALYAHLKERGWTGRYVQHIHDEPHGDERPAYNHFAKLIRGEMPGIPIVDAVSLDQDLGFFADVADIWVPVLGSFDDRMDKIRAHKDHGGQAWFYTCIFPQGRYLNRFTDLPLVKTRLLHWFNFRYGFSGYLHWGGDYWSREPFDNVQPVINDGTTLLPAGDNAIVYPWPEKNTVLSSMRLEAMREGIEDYELLAALSKRDPEKAQQLAKEAIPHFTDYVRQEAGVRRLH